MALVIDRRHDGVLADGVAVIPETFLISVCDITFDTDYAAGGYTLTYDLIGLNPDAVGFTICGITDGGFQPRWNPVTGKLQVFYTDLSTTSDGPLVEVANGADGLDGEVARVVFFGQT